MQFIHDLEEVVAFLHHLDKLLFILPNGTNITANYAGNGTWWTLHTFDDYGVYQVNASYDGLNNVTVSNAKITIKADSTITLDNITFTNNYANEIGGAAGLINNTTLTINNSRFINNYAPSASSINVLFDIVRKLLEQL